MELKAYNGGRCFSADAEKEVPGKPIECSFKQNPARQITEVFLLEGVSGRLRKRGT